MKKAKTNLKKKKMGGSFKWEMLVEAWTWQYAKVNHGLLGINDWNYVENEKE